MTLTYAKIAEWIGPVAEKHVETHQFDEPTDVLRIGHVKLELLRGQTLNPWRSGYQPSALEMADLACMELVRRLNEKGYGVLIDKGTVDFPCNSEGWSTTRSYTTHPLEAVARFVREVGA